MASISSDSLPREVTRWDALTAVCNLLRSSFLGQTVAPHSVPWELIVEVSSFHNVTPAVGFSLQNAAGIPPEVQAYFEEVYSFNTRRNEVILSAVTEAVAILNGAGIEPILLKGASFLATRTYPEIGQRIVGDGDILIPANQIASADKALRAAGYSNDPGDIVPPDTHYHLPMIRDPISGMGFELHSDVHSRDPDAVIATKWFCEDLKPLAMGSGKAWSANATRDTAHVIFHGQIHSELDRLNKIQLRQMLDLVLIRARNDDQIDWDAIDYRFSRAGHGEILATYLQFAEVLFAQPAPGLRHPPRADRLARLIDAESQNSFRVEIQRLAAYHRSAERHANSLIKELAVVEAARLSAEQHAASVETARARENAEAAQALAAVEAARLSAEQHAASVHAARRHENVEAAQALAALETARRNAEQHAASLEAARAQENAQAGKALAALEAARRSAEQHATSLEAARARENAEAAQALAALEIARRSAEDNALSLKAAFAAKYESGPVSTADTSAPGPQNRFLTLHALRGVAAASIVLLHLRFFLPEIKLFNEAYLAVDFFFVLSGFVIAHAYDRRLTEGMRVSTFVKLRVIRLYPLIIFGGILGLFGELIRPLFRNDAAPAFSAVAWTALAMLCLPIVEGAGRARQFFPLNWPQWSLFFELLVNGFYAFAAKHLRTRTLIMIVVVAGCAEILIMFQLGRMNIGRGWLFFAGVPRAACPFFLGVLLFRCRNTWHRWIPSIPSSVFLAILGVSFLPTFPDGGWRVAYELACALVLYPLIVMGASVNEPVRYHWLANWSGELSYPLYILHFPFFALVLHAWGITGNQPGDAGVWIAAACLALILFAYLVLVLIDRPIRARLREALYRRKEARPCTHN